MASSAPARPAGDISLTILMPRNFESVYPRSWLITSTILYFTSPTNGTATRPSNVPAELEAIGLDEALRTYTVGAAQAIGRQDEAGVLAVGRPADLVVLTAEPQVGRPMAESAEYP
jgi:hypothetical protein